MRKYTVLFTLSTIFALLLCGGCTAILFVSAPSYFWIPLVCLICLVISSVTILIRFRHICTLWTHRLSKKVSVKSREALENFPLPIVLLDNQGTVLYTNKLFVAQVMEGSVPTIHTSLSHLFDGASMTEISVNVTVDLVRNGRRYTAYTSLMRGEKGPQYVLYLTDDTELKILADEFEASRPIVLQIGIDNLDEVTEHLRAGDRSRIAGTIETMLEDWITADGGVLQKYADDRFLAVIERRYLSAMTTDRFSILNRVRQSFPETEGNITLSIGIGEGKNVEEGRRMAVRAFDMAVSRGGDQVAIKTINGYDFYGGQSGGLERRTRVRTRIVADALRELMLASDRVLVMGHRVSDLDCLGSGIALVAAARQMKIPASVVVDRESSMAGSLLQAFESTGKGDYFISPAAAEKVLTKSSLLIIVDTHSVDMLESASIYNASERIVLIDHHRRKAQYIDNALLTYHEPNASSASELVAELLPYLTSEPIERTVANALLAGIALDTRNFVIRTGVHTFEAAAYLRSLGADTVAVKKMFTENLNIHRLKNELIAGAQLYNETAIAVSTDDLINDRVAVSQAADDLLTIRGVKASFVISQMGETIHISARSYGECNVQLIMESLGGGGHHTMAAAQLVSITIEEAVIELKAAIDRYKNSHSE